jgi:hypothetical protein
LRLLETVVDVRPLGMDGCRKDVDHERVVEPVGHERAVDTTEITVAHRCRGVFGIEIDEALLAVVVGRDVKGPMCVGPVVIGTPRERRFPRRRFARSTR